MFVTRCPNCEHDNVPGERFCAACGVPLNLRPCPRCGKVDQITAKVCTGCGSAFPAIATATIAATRQDAMPTTPSVANANAAWEKAAEQAPLQVPPAANAPHPNRALPLIVVAIAAGGIPLLWMNRTYLPSPKAWEIQAPAIPGSAVPPNPSLPAAPAGMPPSPLPAAVAATAQPRQQEPAATAPARPRAAVRATPQRNPAAAKPPAPPRPCTEALAALGLCDTGAAPK